MMLSVATMNVVLWRLLNCITAQYPRSLIQWGYSVEDFWLDWNHLPQAAILNPDQ